MRALAVLLACVLVSQVACYMPGRTDVLFRGVGRRAVLRRPAACSVSATADEEDEIAGPLAGEFWTELCEEAEAEADRLGLELESVSFKQGTLSVVASGGVDELQSLNQALSSFLDTAEGAPHAARVLPACLPDSRPIAARCILATSSQATHAAAASACCAETALAELPPFMLEVSTPGLSTDLTTDRDFITFKGFEVNVETSEPHKGKTKFNGTLVGRDDESVTINNKGRLSKLPRALVTLVQLPKAKTEPGDPLSAS